MLAQLLANIRSTDKAKVAKAGGVAVVISLGIQAAVAAGVVIPIWGQFAGIAAGVLAHALLPAKEQEIIDADLDKVIDIATEIPQTYSAPTDFPNPPPQLTPNNLNKS